MRDHPKDPTAPVVHRPRHLAHQPDEYVVVQDMVESATVMGLALADLLGIGAD